MKSPTMGCLCCCFRYPRDEEPNSLVKKSDSSVSSPRKSYGAITIQDEVPDTTSSSSPPRKSPTDLLYTEPPKSARVKSPETTHVTSPETTLVKSPETARVKSPETTKDEEIHVHVVLSEERSSSGRSPEKRTLAEIAEAAKKVTSAFPSKTKSRTSTPSPRPKVESKSNAREGVFDERAVDVPLIPPGGETSAYGSNDSMESDTCHSIGDDEEEEEEESEDARILRMLPSAPPTPSTESGGSQTRLVPKSSTASPGSSTHDLSTGKKQSKAKDFMKKAGKNMKKAKKKVGKGMEKMIPHSKKKEDETKAQGDTKERADSSSANETSSSSNQFKRVSSERMKSKYARDKLAALEKKREDEASHKSAQGFPDPRQAALERGEKLGELEDKTEQMRDQAASFAHNVSLLKNRHASSS